MIGKLFDKFAYTIFPRALLVGIACSGSYIAGYLKAQEFHFDFNRLPAGIQREAQSELREVRELADEAIQAYTKGNYDEAFVKWNGASFAHEGIEAFALLYQMPLEKAAYKWGAIIKSTKSAFDHVQADVSKASDDELADIVLCGAFRFKSYNHVLEEIGPFGSIAYDLKDITLARSMFKAYVRATRTEIQNAEHAQARLVAAKNSRMVDMALTALNRDEQARKDTAIWLNHFEPEIDGLKTLEGICKKYEGRFWEK